MVLFLYLDEIKYRIIYSFIGSLIFMGVGIYYFREIIYLFTQIYCDSSVDFFILTAYWDFLRIYFLVLFFGFITVFLLLLLLNFFLYLSSVIEQKYFESFLLIFIFYFSCIFVISYYGLYSLFYKLYRYVEYRVYNDLGNYRYLSLELDITSVVSSFVCMSYFYLFFVILNFFLVGFIIFDINTGAYCRYIIGLLVISCILFVLPPDVFIHLLFIFIVFFMYESLYIVLICLKNYYFYLQLKK